VRVINHCINVYVSYCSQQRKGLGSWFVSLCGAGVFLYMVTLRSPAPSKSDSTTHDSTYLGVCFICTNFSKSRAARLRQCLTGTCQLQGSCGGNLNVAIVASRVAFAALVSEACNRRLCMVLSVTVNAMINYDPGLHARATDPVGAAVSAANSSTSILSCHKESILSRAVELLSQHGAVWLADRSI
jgi:hypothetical protein